MTKIIFYSWEKIEKKCDGNIACIMEVFRSFLKNPVPKSLLGKSFITNIKDLLNGSNNDVELVQYIYLASLRNYFDFTYQKDSRLYKYFSDIPLEKLAKNKLLTIKDDYINFKYEENYGN